MKILAKIKKFVKENHREIVLFLAIFLISTLSFAIGYLYAKDQIKNPIIIEQNHGLTTYCYYS
jgi:hypothetical protein